MEVDYGIISIAVLKKNVFQKVQKQRKQRLLFATKIHVFLNYSIVNFEKSFARIRLSTFLFLKMANLHDILNHKT